MTGEVRKIVKCIRSGELIATYPMAYAQTIGLSGQSDLINSTEPLSFRSGKRGSRPMAG
jgi:hypothetical protein